LAERSISAILKPNEAWQSRNQLVVMTKILHGLGKVLLGVVLFAGFETSLRASQPANDMFANSIAITGTNTVVTGSNVGGTVEPGEPIHADVPGGASVWWTWTAPSAGTATISTVGSTFDTVLAVYTGASVSSLTLVANNDDDPDGFDLTSKVVFDVVPGQTYQIAVDGFGGDSGNVTLSLQFGPPAPLVPAPPWALPSPYGVMDSSTNYNGRVVLLNFWATWCVPCKDEMPDLVALQQKYGADGLVIVGADVSWSGENASTVTSFLSTWAPTVNYPTVMSTAATEYAYGGIDAIPTSFIIDRQNFIRKKFVGTQSGATFEKQILPLLYGNTRLDSQRNGDQLTLSWPTNAATFTLEWAPNLNGAAWSAWPDTPTVVNGANTVVVPTSDSPAYFRLRLNY
jgi:thiol-disulfide isomerase/thioredoxin